MLTAEEASLTEQGRRRGRLTAEEYREAEFGLTVAESRRGFKIHLLVYALVMTGLSVLNALLWVYAGANFPWAVFPLVGWGIGLTFHYIDGYRGAIEEARSRQSTVERLAEREKDRVRVGGDRKR